MNKKIGLIGTAGLGKSGTARKLSEALNLPLLLSKEITRPILAEHGYDYSKGTCVERFLSRKEIEFEIVNERVLKESQLKEQGFVTDRTTLECFAYALLSVENYTSDEIAMLEQFCRSNMKCYTDVFYFPYNKGWFEENGVRTTSTYFQWKIDCIIRGLLADWSVSHIAITPCNACQEILNIVSSQGL